MGDVCILSGIIYCVSTTHWEIPVPCMGKICMYSGTPQCPLSPLEIPPGMRKIYGCILGLHNVPSPLLENSNPLPEWGGYFLVFSTMSPSPDPLKIPPVWERYGYVLKDMELHAECTLPTPWKFQTPAYVRYGYLLDYMFSHILHVPDLILRVSYNTEESLAVDQGQLTYFELNSDFTS